MASRDAANARRFADEYGIADAHGSYQDLLDDDGIDCVYIPLPNHLHGHWSRRALTAGKHVLCEKPFVTEAAEAQELFVLAGDNGLHLAEAFMYRHHPKTHALKQLISTGVLGDIHTIRAWFTYRAEDPDSDIRFDPDMSGGALRDVGSYPVSMSNYLLDDEPDTVQATAVRSADDVDVRFYAHMRYANDVIATLDCSMHSQSGYGVTVVGALGTATVACPWYSHQPPHHVTRDPLRRKHRDDRGRFGERLLPRDRELRRGRQRCRGRRDPGRRDHPHRPHAGPTPRCLHLIGG